MISQTGLGFVVAGIAIFGVHDILSALRIAKKSELFVAALVDSHHRRACVDAFAWAALAFGMIWSLQGTRSWAHDDDIRLVIASIAGVIWATTPGVWEDKSKHHVILDSDAKPSDNESRDKEIIFSAAYHLFRGVAFFGGFLALAFVAARGKSTVDRKLAFSGAMITSGGLYFSRLTGYRDAKKMHLLAMFVELCGWGLFAGGFLNNEVDVDMQGIDMP